MSEKQIVAWRQLQRSAGNDAVPNDPTTQEWKCVGYTHEKIPGKSVWPEIDYRGNVAQIGFAKWEHSQQPLYAPEKVPGLDA